MAAHTGLDKANAEHAVLHGREGGGRVLTTCLAVGEHITERTVNIRECLDKAFVVACTDAGKPRAGIEQIVCTGGQPLTSSAESSSIAPQRWNLPMYEPSPPPIIPNFSFRGLRCDHCIRDAADCKAVFVARTCGRLNGRADG